MNGARALVLCAILFRPEAAAADAVGHDERPAVGASATKEVGDSRKDDPPSDADVDEETRRYCEAQLAECERRPRTRVGCIPEPRCRVWDAARRAPAGS